MKNEGGKRVDEKLKERFREILSDCYGVDIKEAKMFFSTQNYAFILQRTKGAWLQRTRVQYFNAFYF